MPVAQPQPAPGLAAEMNPKPDHGEESYRGSGRLKGRRALMERVRATARGKALPGADAARSQDFLYSDDGLPG